MLHGLDQFVLVLVKGKFISLIISHAIWLYHCFCLCFREVEDLLAERDITVFYETIRQR